MPTGTYRRKSKGVYKGCKYCGKEFYVYLSELSIKFFCKKDCYSNWQKTQLGILSSQWKGDKVSYEALHIWINKRLGKLKYCQNCKTTKAKKYEWANISRQYKRDFKDWKRLCTSCHRKFDNHSQKMWETRRLKQQILAI